MPGAYTWPRAILDGLACLVCIAGACVLLVVLAAGTQP